MFPKYKIAYILFWLFCIASILVLIQQIGTSGILAVFNGAVTSKELVLGKDVSMEIFIFVVHLLVPCILTLWMTAETKRQKINAIIALTIYIMETLLFGFTRIFLISILGMILLYEIRKKGQKKQIMIVSLGLVALVLLMVMMNFIRTFGLQSERDISSIFDIEYIFNSTDFSASYYWLDELLNFDSPFINPIVYLKPIFAMVPRSIWETKPEPLSLQILRYVNPARAATGYSTAGNTILGEGYAIMSWLGVFVAPFIWGTICGKMDKAYYRRLENGADHSLQNIFYYIFAIFIVISGQRGDWSQYIMIVIWFYMLPMYIMSKVSSRMRN